MKITPAHDPKDYEVGVRHGLEFIDILNDDSRCGRCGPVVSDAICPGPKRDSIDWM